MDIFDDMQQQTTCMYISDLHYRQKELLKILRKTELTKYPQKQVNNFCQYVFGMSYQEFLENYSDMRGVFK